MSDPDSDSDIFRQFIHDDEEYDDLQYHQFVQHQHHMNSDESSDDFTGDDSREGEMDAVDGDDDDVIFLDQVEVTASARQETLESTCKNHLLALFPDITSDYLDEISSLHAFNAEAAASAILDQYPNLQYPKSAANPLKRKRSDDSDEEKEPEVARTMKAKLSANNYLRNLDSRDYQDLARSLISQEFPRVPVLTIRNSLLENRQSLFEAYTKLDDAFRSWDDANPPWKAKTRPSKVDGDFTPERFANLDLSKYNEAQQAAIEELRAARELRSIKDAKIMAEAEEKSNFTRAQKDGQITECGCCYNDCALNRMVQCSGDVIHWFCRDCMRSQAEAQIGLSKYELTCMSVDGCTAGFSHAQRELFLDKKLSTALCRIEQEAVLREAGIENLETCPFCPYAAEYPTIDVNKEFRCEDPDCGRVSCRLCRKDTHIPKTCAEAAADEGIDARHILEEAMSAALIRTCNKCKNPFIKQDGCNKIICTKCHTIQCDVCRKTVKDYSHFNDAGRGGKIGQCPLFDTTEQRHQEEVRQAEEATRKRVAEENPELDSETLQIKVSERVKQDELNRRQRDPRYQAPPQAQRRQVGRDFPGPPIPYPPPDLQYLALAHENARQLQVNLQVNLNQLAQHQGHGPGNPPNAQVPVNQHALQNPHPIRENHANILGRGQQSGPPRVLRTPVLASGRQGLGLGRLSRHLRKFEEGLRAGDARANNARIAAGPVVGQPAANEANRPRNDVPVGSMRTYQPLPFGFLSPHMPLNFIPPPQARVADEDIRIGVAHARLPFHLANGHTRTQQQAPPVNNNHDYVQPQPRRSNVNRTIQVQARCARAQLHARPVNPNVNAQQRAPEDIDIAEPRIRQEAPIAQPHVREGIGMRHAPAPGHRIAQANDIPPRSLHFSIWGL